MEAFNILEEIDMPGEWYIDRNPKQTLLLQGVRMMNRN